MCFTQDGFVPYTKFRPFAPGPLAQLEIDPRDTHPFHLFFSNVD